MEDIKEERFGVLCWFVFWRKPPENEKEEDKKNGLDL